MISTDAGWALTIAVFLPAVGAAILAMMPSANDRLVRWTGVGLTGLTFVWTAVLAISFDYGNAGQAAVRDDRAVDRRDLRALPHRDRRHLHAAVLPDLAADVPVRDLHAQAPAQARQAQGLPGPDAAAADGHGGHVHRLRPGAVLHLLGDRAGPDVLHDRDVGRSAARVRQRQVLPLHVVRLGLHADRVPGDLLPGAVSRPGQPVGHRRADRAGHRRQPHVPAVGVRRDLPRLRHQGPDVAVPHLAARRAHRGADGRLGPAGRRAAEDGHLRLHPHRAADPARRRCCLRTVDRCAGGDRHHLRLVVLSRPDPGQAPDRVLVGRATWGS